MTTPSLKAKDYIKALDLAGTPRGLIAQGPETEAGEVFEQAKRQAQVVGSGLLAFEEGVVAEVREAISDAALLAQLVANKRSDPTNPIAWFKEYATVLQNVGWIVQDGGWSKQAAHGTIAEVHEKVIGLLPVLLGPAPAALAIATAALTALRGMKPESSWITIFSRESQHARIARFQVGLVENTAGGGVQISLIAFLLEAKSSVTQVLFFKFKEDEASFRANAMKASINTASMNDLALGIRTKVRAYQADYLSSIHDI